MMRSRALIAAAAWAGLAATATHAQTVTKDAQAPCVSAAEAEGALLVIAPGAVRGLVSRCRPMLAPGSYLETSGKALVARYDEAAAGATAGNAAIAKLLQLPAGAADAVGGVAGFSEMMIGTVKLDAETCGAIDRAFALLEPLPPRNLASLLVLVLELTRNDKDPPPINICPAAKG